MSTDKTQFEKNEVSASFDRMADYYADERGRSPFFQEQVKIMLEMIDSKPGCILDIGCAAGAEFEPLLARGFRIVGFDYAPDMIRLARRRFSASPDVRLCRADAEMLPFHDASFDHVVCLGVLEYLATYDRALEEIHRVLRPGGSAIISLPTSISLDRASYNLIHKTALPLWRGTKRLMGKQSSRKELGRRWNRCVPSRFQETLREHNLNPEKSAYSGFLLFPLGNVWPAAELRLFSLMERFSKSPLLGWTLSQYLVSARKPS